jgi:hypothetical protein
MVTWLHCSRPVVRESCVRWSPRGWSLRSSPGSKVKSSRLDTKVNSWSPRYSPGGCSLRSSLAGWASRVKPWTLESKNKSGAGGGQNNHR